jgi:4-amino-4-deoxy-L-arabinose transferase-like glycosyltransferase
MRVPSRRTYAITAFLISLACYGYSLPKALDWAGNSRADLTFAVGDQGVLYIDAYHENTGDKAFFEDHYYTEKSIGPSLLALPFYMVFKVIAAFPPINDFLHSDRTLGDVASLQNPDAETLGIRPNTFYEDVALTFISFFATSVPSALLVTAVMLFAARFARKDSYAFALALIYGLATIAFPYSTVLYQHQIATFGLFVGFFLLWRVLYEQANPRWMWAVGGLFGLAAITELPVVPFAGFIFLWGVYQYSNKLALYRVVLGAMPLLVVHFLYHHLIYGNALTVSYLYSVYWQDFNQQGVVSVTMPSAERLYGITVSSFRGLFFISPVLLIALPGLLLMWQQPRRYRSMTLLLIFIIAGFFLYNASSVQWWAGHSIGPRYLTPMLPFMALPMVFVSNQWLPRRPGRILIGTLVALSAFNVWTQFLAGQVFPPVNGSDGATIQNPLVQYALPLLMKGDVTRNYGTLLGLPGLPSLLPLLIFIAATYYVMLWRADKQLRPTVAHEH